ncbi:MAG: DapH/DapD/GlmU-related protein [Succinivibrio sp.]|nr:DapH/DapD/GlmU-related protein [Succinivibrio sp.]MDY6260577.1 DapH/DapD/GlmU-related protein [Succinivibrio sp.]
MHPIKYLWGIRAYLYKLILGKIGNMSYIGKPIYIGGCKNIYIGNRVRIFPGIRIEAIGKGTIKIEDNCAIEQNVHITSGFDELKINKNTTIAAYAFITNIDHEYSDISKSVLEQPLIPKKTVIGEGCFIGYGASIQAGTILGKHCVVGTGAVVKGEFPDYSVIVGVPGKIVKKYDVLTKKWKKL